MALKSTVNFNDGATSITINGPAPSDFDLLARTASEQSANYDMRSYKFTDKKLRRWQLTFLDLNQTQKDNLINFFTDSAVGPSNTFIYTHTNGVAYTSARFVNDALQVRRTEPGIFTVNVVLEFDAQQIQ